VLRPRGGKVKSQWLIKKNAFLIEIQGENCREDFASVYLSLA